MSVKKQAVITTVFGRQINQLDQTFLSFSRNKFLELHAFIIGDKLPEKRFPEIKYHLCAPDDGFVHPFRDCQHRRFLFPDLLDVEYAIVVDGTDVLCLQDLPEIPDLLRGASVGGCVEYRGGSRLMCGLSCANYMNDGVSFWHLPSSRKIREAIVSRGRSMFRTLWDDQESFNEVINTLFYDQLIILPCQYNYRGMLNIRRRGWATVSNLDGVKIYHCRLCVEAAKKILPFAPVHHLKPLAQDTSPPKAWQQRWRRCRHQIKRYE
jgi:lipopolysaccharide biosynthesis glycosyltransferase